MHIAHHSDDYFRQNQSIDVASQHIRSGYANFSVFTHCQEQYVSKEINDPYVSKFTKQD